MQVIPAILTKTPEEFSSQLQKLAPYFTRFQIDIADGKFVPNTTLQLDGISQAFRKDVTFDFHLMVKDYESEIQKIARLSHLVKVRVIFIHASRSPNYKLLTANYPHYSFGLVLNPEDSVNTIRSNYDLFSIEHVQIMTIIPGSQEQPFIPETLLKIEQLRTINYGLKIYLDGSINDQTIPIIQQLKKKPDFLGVGSFLTHAKNVEERVKYLQTVIDSSG